ncbi:MAG: hypothetical protein U0271_31350 [Polyangiaceae bacterium]
MSSPLFAIFLVGATVICFVAIAVWYMSAEQVKKRTLTAAPLRSLAELADGEVGKIRGEVKLLGKALRGPLSRRKCAYWLVHVEEYESGDDSGRWVTVLKEERGRDFLLLSDGAKVRVEMDGADVLGQTDHEQKSGTWNDATPELEAFLAKRGLKSHGLLFNRNLRYREVVLEPGERVTALGKLGSEEDPDPEEAGQGYRDSPKRRVIGPPSGARLIVSDLGDV